MDAYSTFFHDKTNAERQMLRGLRRTRCGYDQERLLHNFLLDAYVGGGGFQNGFIPSPDAPFWGRRAYERGRSTWLDNRNFLIQRSSGPTRGAEQSQTSYLVAFHGEDSDSYLDRIKVAAYHNPGEKIVRVTNALLFQTDATRENLPQSLAEWLPNVDRRRRPINHVARNVGLRCQLFGWAGTLVDLPTGVPLSSMAESVEASRMPYTVPLCPQEILDWDMRPDGTLSAVKISTMHEHPRTSLFDLKLWEEHITLIYEDRWERYIVLMPPPETIQMPMWGGQVNYFDPEEGRLWATDTGPNPFGVVPISFCAWDEGFGGVSSFGLPQIFNVAKAAWDLFQQNSELRTIMRGQTFSTLIAPAAEGGAVGNRAVGVGNFLHERAKDKGITRYISPPSGPAQVYEKRMEGTGEMLHQISGLDINARRYTETAEAMKIRFQQTEAMLFNAATNLESWELGVIRLAGSTMSVREAALTAITIYRQKTFDVSRYSTQIDEALKSMRVPWGKQVLKAILRRTLRSALPNASERDLVEYDREVDATVEANYDNFLEQALAYAGTSAANTPASPTTNPNPSQTT